MSKRGATPNPTRGDRLIDLGGFIAMGILIGICMTLGLQYQLKVEHEHPALAVAK